MTISDTAVPAAGSHPYPDLTVLPEAWVTDLTATYEAMAAKERAANDEWEIGARARVFPQPGRHAKPAVMVTAPDQARALTVPDPLPVPQFRPAAVPELPRRRPSVFARHLRRDRPAESRNGTSAPPVPDERDADTLLPGSVGPVPALDPEQAQRLARFNDAHDQQDAEDGTSQMTAVLPVPAEGERNA